MVQKVNVNIADVARRAKVRVDTAAKEVANDLAETVVQRTPVRTGFLRGSWFTSLNEQSASFQGSEDKTGAQSVGRVSLAINQAQIGDTIYILNGAAYAPFVEFGTKNQAPQSFVRSTINDAPQIAEETIRRIART